VLICKLTWRRSAPSRFRSVEYAGLVGLGTHAFGTAWRVGGSRRGLAEVVVGGGAPGLDPDTRVSQVSGAGPTALCLGACAKMLASRCVCSGLVRNRAPSTRGGSPGSGSSAHRDAPTCPSNPWVCDLSSRLHQETVVTATELATTLQSVIEQE
jgi:hypothetical protein